MQPPPTSAPSAGRWRDIDPPSLLSASSRRLSRRRTAMTMNADTARGRTSLGVGIQALGLAARPCPTRADHQRLQIVAACEAERRGPPVLRVDLDLTARYWPAADEFDQGLGRERRG